MPNAAASKEDFDATTRQTPREGDNPHPRPPFTPSARLLDGHAGIIKQKNITIGALLAGLLLVVIAMFLVNSDQKVIVIDPVGGATQGPLEPLASSKGYFAITSINATQAALQRSSVGFDLQELLSVYFSANARKKLTDDMEKHVEEMRRRRLSYKPVVESITPPQSAGDGRAVKVTGRIQSAGYVNGRTFYEEMPFVLVLTFRANSDLANKAAMPWLADEVDVAIGDEEVEALNARAKNVR